MNLGRLLVDPKNSSKVNLQFSGLKFMSEEVRERITRNRLGERLLAEAWAKLEAVITKALREKP